MHVEKNHIISIRYTMKNGQGVMLENTMMADPVNYLHGSSSIEAGLQAQLEGLERGARKKIYLLSSSGLATDDFEFDVIIDDIHIATEEEIILGYPVNKYSSKCEEDCVCYNHQINK
jgi:FKBP-type peptidyl-prolyl cis-trans isomerase SlyD